MESSREKNKILYMLLVAKEPISESQVAEFSDVDVKLVRQVLREVQFMVPNVGSSQTPKYFIGTGPFRSFLEMNDTQEKAEVTDKDAHKSIADSILSKIPGFQW